MEVGPYSDTECLSQTAESRWAQKSSGVLPEARQSQQHPRKPVVRHSEAYSNITLQIGVEDLPCTRHCPQAGSSCEQDGLWPCPDSGHPVGTGDQKLVTQCRPQKICSCATCEEADKGGDGMQRPETLPRQDVPPAPRRCPREETAGRGSGLLAFRTPSSL